MSDLKTRLNELSGKLQVLKDEYIRASREFLGKEFQEIFVKYPKLNKFSWRQYTPYFCDGDPCEFGVNADSWGIALNGKTQDDVKYFKWNETTRKTEQLPFNPETMDFTFEEFKLILDDIKTIVNAIPDENLLVIYGDHAEVVIMRDGRHIVEEYEHD